MFPSATYNGTDTLDELSSILNPMSQEELNTLMNNGEEVARLAKDTQEVKRSIQAKEMSLAENRRLAEANLALEPQFNRLKQELVDTYEKLSEARKKYESLKSDIDKYSAKYSPRSVRALMLSDNMELEGQSEQLANQFHKGDIDVDAFIENYVPLRKCYNERKFKVDKLTENLSRGQPIANSQPTGGFHGSQYSSPSQALHSDPFRAGPLYPGFHV